MTGIVKDKKTLTINIYQRHLKWSSVKEYYAKRLNFYDIDIKHIGKGALKYTIEPALEDGYKVILHFDGKSRLIIFNDARKLMLDPNKPWKKPPIEGGVGACLCCSVTADILNLKTVLYFGVAGGWVIKKDGQEFFQEEGDKDWDDCKKLEAIEALIPEGDNSEYTAHLDTPMRDAVYQRHDKNQWVLIQKGPGWA